MNARFIRCQCGRTYLVKPGERPCNPCNQPDPRYDEHDSHGRLIRQRNARRQLVFQAAATNTLELWGDTGPRRATPGGALAALDQLTSNPGPFGALT